MNELDSLRQEAETLKNAIRVSIFIHIRYNLSKLGRNIKQQMNVYSTVSV